MPWLYLWYFNVYPLKCILKRSTEVLFFNKLPGTNKQVEHTYRPSFVFLLMLSSSFPWPAAWDIIIQNCSYQTRWSFYVEIKCLIFHRKAYTKAQKNSMRTFELPSLLPCRWGDALPTAEGPPEAIRLHDFSNNFVCCYGYQPPTTHSYHSPSLDHNFKLSSVCSSTCFRICFASSLMVFLPPLFSLFCLHQDSFGSCTHHDFLLLQRHLSLLPSSLIQYPPSILPLMASLTPKVSKKFAAFHPLLPSPTLQLSGPVLYEMCIYIYVYVYIMVSKWWTDL